MCGISGLINIKGASVEKQLLQRMTDIIVYRGPDDSGYYYDGSIGLGHRRLSIIDLSSAGHQPMKREHLQITYNGELYNYIELREELKALGQRFDTNTDTEVILAAYQQWGIDAFHKFNGMWAFAIYDNLSKSIICSRDRFGIKPFCYTQTDTYFGFASESKQLLEIPNIDKSLNMQVVYNYLHNAYLNVDENTFIDSIKELRGGHYLTFDLIQNTFEVNRWYQIPTTTETRATFEAASNNFRSTFEKSVTLRMRSDVTVGSCLSGGLDSTAIVCTALKKKLANNSFKTISSCYADKASDEQEYIDVVTAQTQIEAIKIFPDLNRLISENVWDKIIFHQDQPILSFSHFSEFAVFEAAAQNNMVVLLDGQGSDEYLAGYTEFIGAHLRGLLHKFRFGAYLKFLYQRSKLLKVPFLTLLKHRILTDIKGSTNSSESLGSFFTESFKNVSDVKKYKATSISELSAVHIEKLSIPFQLHSEDRNSMMHSIESRLPFLDYNLVQLAFSLPESYKLRNGKTKALLRAGLKDSMPKEIIERHDKKGFPAPDIELFKNNSEEITELLKKTINQSPEIFNSSLVTSFEEFMSGSRPYNSLWLRAISFYKWRQLFNL